MSQFRHNRLQKGEIRLLRFKPESTSNFQRLFQGAALLKKSGIVYPPLECEIDNYSLEKCPLFAAISYTWGREEGVTKITVNGYPWSVRQNLGQFLRLAQGDSNRDSAGCTSCRHTGIKTALNSLGGLLNQNGGQKRRAGSCPHLQLLEYFWIDALCIDQSNVSERNSQVAMMREIYKASKRIIIWLGPPTKCHRYVAIDAYHHYARQYKAKYRPRESSLDPPIVEIPDKVIDAINCLNTRDWWMRSWIVQEASTPNVQKEIWYGRKRVAWEDLVFVQQLLWDMSAYRQASILVGRNECLAYLGHLEKARAKSHSLTFLDLLVRGREFKATDPRDKVYAFWGIWADIRREDEGSLEVDYSIPASRVFQSAAIHIIKTTDNLNLLLHCESIRSQPTPSWVPDFSSAPLHHAALRMIKGKAAGNVARRISFENNMSLLIVRGSHADVIADVVPPLLPPTGEVPSRTPMEFVLKSTTFLEWVRAVSRLAYQSNKDEDKKYAVEGMSVTGALNLLVQMIPDTGNSLASTPNANVLCRIPFLEVLNGERIENAIHALVCTDILRNRIPSLSVFRTEKGYLGFGDEAVVPGDTIATLNGLSSPAILRRNATGNWRLFGPCFVVGMMLGELESVKLQEEDFRIE